MTNPLSREEFRAFMEGHQKVQEMQLAAIKDVKESVLRVEDKQDKVNAVLFSELKENKTKIAKVDKEQLANHKYLYGKMTGIGVAIMAAMELLKSIFKG